MSLFATVSVHARVMRSTGVFEVMLKRQLSTPFSRAFGQLDNSKNDECKEALVTFSAPQWDQQKEV